jgi:hypothetical protein
LIGSNNHDLRDLGIAQEGFKRAKAENIIKKSLDQGLLRLLGR